MNTLRSNENIFMRQVKDHETGETESMPGYYAEVIEMWAFSVLIKLR